MDIIQVTDQVVLAFVWAPMLAMAAISAAGAAYQAHSAKQAADKQMKFQQAMSDTAHQRQVADLRQAGLNPILSARLGGASTPSGAQPSTIPNIGAAAAQGYMQMANTAAQVQEREASANLLEEQKATENTRQELNLSQAKAANADAYLKTNQGAKTFQETEVLHHRMPMFRNEGAFHDWIGPAIRGMAPAKDAAGIISSIWNAITRWSARGRGGR